MAAVCLLNSGGNNCRAKWPSCSNTYSVCIKSFVATLKKRKKKIGWLIMNVIIFSAASHRNRIFFFFAFLYVDVLSSNLRDNESAYPFSIGC